MEYIPHEFAFGGVYFPPLLIASVLGTLTAMVVVTVLNYYNLTSFFYYPPLLFMALIIIFTGLFGTFFVPV